MKMILIATMIATLATSAHACGRWSPCTLEEELAKGLQKYEQRQKDLDFAQRYNNERFKAQREQAKRNAEYDRMTPPEREAEENQVRERLRARVRQQTGEE